MKLTLKLQSGNFTADDGRSVAYESIIIIDSKTGAQFKLRKEDKALFKYAYPDLISQLQQGDQEIK